MKNLVLITLLFSSALGETFVNNDLKLNCLNDCERNLNGDESFPWMKQLIGSNNFFREAFFDEVCRLYDDAKSCVSECHPAADSSHDFYFFVKHFEPIENILCKSRYQEFVSYLPCYSEKLKTDRCSAICGDQETNRKAVFAQIKREKYKIGMTNAVTATMETVCSFWSCQLSCLRTIISEQCTGEKGQNAAEFIDILFKELIKVSSDYLAVNMPGAVITDDCLNRKHPHHNLPAADEEAMTSDIYSISAEDRLMAECVYDCTLNSFPYVLKKLWKIVESADFKEIWLDVKNSTILKELLDQLIDDIDETFINKLKRMDFNEALTAILFRMMEFTDADDFFVSLKSMDFNEALKEVLFRMWEITDADEEIVILRSMDLKSILLLLLELGDFNEMITEMLNSEGYSERVVNYLKGVDFNAVAIEAIKHFDFDFNEDLSSILLHHEPNSNLNTLGELCLAFICAALDWVNSCAAECQVDLNPIGRAAFRIMEPIDAICKHHYQEFASYLSCYFDCSDACGDKDAFLAELRATYTADLYQHGTAKASKTLAKKACDFLTCTVKCQLANAMERCPGEKGRHAAEFYETMVVDKILMELFNFLKFIMRDMVIPKNCLSHKEQPFHRPSSVNDREL